jgi:hypothetical protein
MNYLYQGLALLLMATGVAPAADSIVTLGAGTGQPGSKNNVISVSLSNPDPVKSMQVQIADLPNFLKADSVWLTNRCTGFNVYYSEVEGNLNIILISSSQYVTPDTGAVLQISYSITADTDTSKQVALLFSKKPTVVGENYQALPVQAINSHFTLSGTAAVDHQGSVPAQFQLQQNYPNPFNPTTQIAFSLEKSDWVSLAVYNSLGRQIRTLINRSYQPGAYQVTWDGCDDYGHSVAGGAYFYRLVTADKSLTRQMIYLR